MAAESWLARTRQSWKLYAFLGTITISIGLFVVTMAVDPASHASRFIAMLVAAAVLAAAAFLWFCLAIRCPACGGRPAWWSIRTQKSSAWFVVLVGMRVCPICGDEPAPVR